MELNLTEPAVMFPAVSLLLLAYTNRFLAITQLIRSLLKRYRTNPCDLFLRQVIELRRRMVLIRNMQIFGILGLFLCVFCMFLIFEGQQEPAEWLFDGSLISLLISLGLSLREIQISTRAIQIELDSIEQAPPLELLPQKAIEP